MTYHPFFFRKDGFLKKIDLEEIVFIEAADNYVKFVAQEYNHTIRISLDATMAKLPEKMFIRIHRSFAVSMNYVDTIGKEYVLIGKYQFPVSKKYYNEFIKKLNILESSMADPEEQNNGASDPEPFHS